MRSIDKSSPVVRLPSKRLLVGFFVACTTLVFFILASNYSLSAVFFPGYNPYDISRILELILLLLVALVLFLSKQQTDAIVSVLRTTPKSIRYLLLLVFCSGLCSSLLAHVTKMALLEVSLYILLFCFSLVIAAQRVQWGILTDRTLITLISCFTVFYLVYFFYFYLHVLFFSADHTLAQFPGFVNLRFFAEFQIWTLPILAIPACYKTKPLRLYHIAAFMLLALWWSLAIVNGSKGLWLACLFAAVVVAALFKKNAGRFLLVQLAAVLVGALLTGLLFIGAPKIINAHEAIHTHAALPLITTSVNTPSMLSNNVTPVDITYHARTMLWQQSLTLIKAHPFMGVGPMHYAYYFNNYGAHPHNALLLIASEWGLPVAIVVLFIILWGGYSWLKFFRTQSLVNYDSIDSIVAPALTFAAVAGLLYMQVGGAIVTPLSQVMLAIIWGWALGYYQSRTQQFMHKTSTMMHSLLILILLGCCWIIVSTVYPLLHNLSQQEIEWYLRHQPQAIFEPRFWMQGWLY